MVSWVKCQGDVWCSLERVNLSGVNTTGVYIIWHGGPQPRVVYVGQGNIAERVGAHRNDHRILKYRQHGDLYVTWAAVAWNEMDGVERHLADHWQPLEGDAHPDVYPIAVNSPW
jgi:hypothetical protein